MVRILSPIIGLENTAILFMQLILSIYNMQPVQPATGITCNWYNVQPVNRIGIKIIFEERVSMIMNKIT